VYFQIFSASIPAALVQCQLRFCGSKPAVKYVFSQGKTIPKAFGFEAATQ
jgi:hypothetical protein